MFALVDIWTSQVEKLRQKGQQNFFSREPMTRQEQPAKAQPEKEGVSGHGLQLAALPVMPPTEATFSLFMECFSP